jgi:hypothetical protein
MHCLEGEPVRMILQGVGHHLEKDIHLHMKKSSARDRLERL